MSRIIAPAPRSELERRWRLVRDRLHDQQIDALVIVGESSLLSGVVRWLIDRTVGYRTAIIFDAHELMTVVEHGGAGQIRDMDGDVEGYPGVGRAIGMSAFPSVNYTAKYEAEVVCKLVRERGYRRVALYNADSAQHGFISTLKEILSEVEFIDEGEFIDRCKAIKSPAEIEVLERGAAIQDETLRRSLDYIRPGRTDGDIVAYTYYQAQQLGADNGVILVGSARPGEPAYYRMTNQLGRVVEAGDYLNFLVEVGSPGGYFSEVGRPISLGPPSAELVDLFEQAKEAQAFTFSLLQPGARAADISAAYGEYMQKAGQPRELRLFSHGQGYDFIERPLIRDDETMTLDVGMNLAVHPSFATRGGTHVTLCDNVIVESGGPRVLHKTPKEILQV